MPIVFSITHKLMDSSDEALNFANCTTPTSYTMMDPPLFFFGFMTFFMKQFPFLNTIGTHVGWACLFRVTWQ